MHKVIYLIVACGVLLSGCNSLEKELKKQQDEVMVVHDEAMAQMDALHNFEVSYRTKVEELKTKRFVIRKSLIGKNVVISTWSMIFSDDPDNTSAYGVLAKVVLS